VTKRKMLDSIIHRPIAVKFDPPNRPGKRGVNVHGTLAQSESIYGPAPDETRTRILRIVKGGCYVVVSVLLRESVEWVPTRIVEWAQ